MLIKSVFNSFLKEQELRLAPSTYNEYESVILLFGHCLHSYAWNSLEKESPSYDEVHHSGKSFIDAYDHNHILDSVGEFLGYFVPRKVIAGDEFTRKTCPRVIRKLLRWMQSKELIHITSEEIKERCESQS